MLAKIKFIILSFICIFTSACYADANTNMLLHQANDPIAGNPNGKTTVVEFFDYQCSHCMSMAPVIASIIKANPDVRIVFKDFPIRGPMSEVAARAALAANMQGKYFNFSHDLLSTSQFLTEQTIMDIAKNAGLNIQQLKSDMNSSRVTDQIRNTYAIAKALGIEATPAFYIGPTNAQDMKQLNFTLGEMSQTELQQAIDKAK